MIRSLLRVKWLTKNIAQCSNVPGTHSYKFICRSLYITHINLQQLDYYTVLGLNKNVSQNEIKSAYYQLSKKYHPDVAGSDAAAAKKFLEINEAYECLKDPEKRRSYDSGSFGNNSQFNGNYSDPFYQFYQQTYRKTYQGNPFHNRQFTQAEYERIWNEFNRLRNTREFHERQNEFLRNKIWMDYAKRRAERWQSFHERYPNGAPGSVKWEFRFGRNEGGEKRYFTGKELLRTLFMTYFVCFMIVSFFQLLYQAFNLRPQTERGIKYEEVLNKDKIEAMMSRRPESPTSYMYSPPGRSPQIVEDTGIPAVPSEASAYNIGKEVTFSDGIGSEFSTYVSSK